MPSKLLIIISQDPGDTLSMATILSRSRVAAAMEYEVEVIFTGHAAKLACEGIAQGLPSHLHSHHSLHDLIKESVDDGVVFKVCSAMMESMEANSISEIQDTVGEAYIISEAMDSDCRVMTF
ncbi:MAG: peroxiredoxin [Gammaproteobacteria bacterium]|nr:peroxiredoxin [Gammaproteobacteria bacterium]